MDDLEPRKILPLGLPSDYLPSQGELNNVCYVVCRYGANWPMRSTDLAVCLFMIDRAIRELRGDPLVSEFLWVVCDYVWDHILGEPESPTVEQLFDYIRPGIEEWYRVTDPEARSVIAEEEDQPGVQQ